MSEIARQGPRKTELEVSSIPEVAAFATELTTLFNALEIPQQQYAVRVTLDKSTVSRFLNGKRVASQDFIDRLLGEVERHRRTPVTDEARARIKALRLSALQKADPASFQLENLRDELDRSHRTIKQLQRQQEALELLLDQREAEAEGARREMHELRSLWISEQHQSAAENSELTIRNNRLKGEREKLWDEIRDLKEQLSQLTELKTVAEERCSRLEERLLEAERELAEHLEDIGEQSFSFTPHEVLAEIKQSELERRYYDAARTLSLSAAHLSTIEIPELWDLLIEAGRKVDADTLVRDAIRFRSAAFCAQITEELLARDYAGFDPRRTVGELLGTYKTPDELDYLYERWKQGGPPYGVLRNALRTWAIHAPYWQVFTRLQQIIQDGDTTITVRMLNGYGTRDTHSVITLSDWLLDQNMKEQFETLFRRWRSGIVESNVSKVRDEWLLLAAGSRNSVELARAFNGVFRR